MVYTRGSKDDYDRLASVTGDNGFNWSNMNTYFKKVRLFPSISSRFLPAPSSPYSHIPSSFRVLPPTFVQLENFTVANVANASSKFNSRIHSTTGPVGATLPTVGLPTDEIGLQAQQQLAQDFPYNPDLNSGDMIGFSKHSSSHALTPTACGRTNNR